MSAMILAVSTWDAWLARAGAAGLRLVVDETGSVEWDGSRAWICYPC